MSLSKTLIESTALGLNPRTTSGAAAVAAGLGITLDGDGNIIANVVPRTGTLSSLLSIAGGVGEVASATDVPVLVKFNGVIGGAVVIAGFGTADEINGITANATVTVPANIRRRAYVVDTTAGNVTLTLNFAAGYFIGQRLQIEFDNIGTQALIATSGTNGPAGYTFIEGQSYDLAWNSSNWDVRAIEWVNGSSGGLAILGGQAAGAGTAIGNGAGSIGPGQLALSGGTAVNLNQNNETGIATGSRSLKIFNDLLATTASTSATELTLDGLAGASGNRIAFPAGEACLVRTRIVLGGRIGSSGSNACSNTYDVLLSVSSAGAMALVAQSAGTMLTSGTIGTPTVVIGVTSNHLTFTVTPVVATSTNWTASVESTKQMM